MRASAARPVFSSIGDSSLRQLAALLKRARILITNDTGPMHVAAAVGTRVMDISSGPVCAYETGPYGTDHVVVEPDMSCHPCPLDSECHHYACRFTLSPIDAAAVARFAMGEGPVPVLAGARVLRARRVGPTGRLEFVPVGSPVSLKDHVRMEAARVWEQSLGAPARVGDDWPDETSDLVMVAADDEEQRSAISEIDAQLRRVVTEAEAAAAVVRTLPKAAPAKIPTLAAGVHASLEKLLAIGESERATHAIVTHLRHEIDSVAGTDLASIARAQAVAYGATAARARTLADRLTS